MKLEGEVYMFWYSFCYDKEVIVFPLSLASFEVTIDGQLVHSKLSTNSFPDFEEVASIVQKVESGSKPTQVVKTQSAGCSIL